MPSRSVIGWYSFLIMSGAASTAVEIVGLRLLTPVFGSSLPVWGMAIATVIGGLALGYARGSVQAQQPTTRRQVYCHAALAAIFFMWLPVAMKLAAWFKDQALIAPSNLAWLGALAVSFPALLPPAIVFGTMSPLAVQVEASTRRESAGKSAGRIMALTTVGSILGILVPSFITIPLLGTRETVWLFAGLLLILTLPHILLFRPNVVHASNNRNVVLVLGAAGGALAPLFFAQPPDIIFAAETKHQYITVHQSPDGDRLLKYDAGFGIQSVLPKGLYTKSYWDYPATLPLLLTPSESHAVLVLGAATSASERQMSRLWHGYRSFFFTSVELDESLKDIAEAYFDPPPRRFITADARLHLEADPAVYDIIIVDAYTRELTVPFHMATTEFFQKVSLRLKKQGIVALNINTNGPETLFMRSIARTLHETFDYIRIMHVPHSCNYLVVASHEPLHERTPPQDIPPALMPLVPALQAMQEPRADGILLSDNRSPTDLLGLDALLNGDKQGQCT